MGRKPQCGPTGAHPHRAEGASARAVKTRSIDDRELTNETARKPFQPETGRMLGGQIVGVEGAANRIDVLATAIWSELAVAEVRPATD